MKRFNLPAPAFFFIVATRALLGAGIGLLVADKFGRRQRHKLGAALVCLGALTTIPALLALSAGSRKAQQDVPLATS